MIDENGIQTTNVDFGNAYFGQYKDREFFLVNNSPVDQPFKTKFSSGKQQTMEDSENVVIQTPYQVGVEQS